MKSLIDLYWEFCGDVKILYFKYRLSNPEINFFDYRIYDIFFYGIILLLLLIIYKAQDRLRATNALCWQE